MEQTATDEDIFIREFRANRNGRKRLVADLIGGAGRLTMNVPGRGVARRIAERLREGPFSDYYEFEKLLARALHPLMAGLNLNVVSDLQVNTLFSERYPVYARDMNVALASARKLTPQALKPVIVKMAEAEGHYMVIKFYDLVLRGIDADLYKTLKPVEGAMVRMKYALGDDGAHNLSQVKKIYREFRDGKGADAARLLLVRMEWDNALRAYQPEPADDAEASTESGGYPAEMADEATVDDWDDSSGSPEDEAFDTDDVSEQAVSCGENNAITRYARLIREEYLEAIAPVDEGKIRGIIKGIYIKNQKVYDAQKAADVVREVLAIWLADESLDEDVRGILEDISIEEDTALNAAEQEFAPEAETETEFETVSDHAAAVMDLNGKPAEEGEPDIAEEIQGTGEILELPEDAITIREDESPPTGEEAADGGEPDELPAEGVDGVLTDKAVHGHEDGAPSPESGVSDSEMEALLDDLSKEPVDEKNDVSSGHEGKVTEEAGISGGEMEALLNGISDEAPADDAKADVEQDAQAGMSYGETEALLAGISDEVPVGDDKPAGVAPAESAPLDVDEVFEPVEHEAIPGDADSFVVKDEILFEDRSLVKKGQSPRVKPQKIRISMREIADTESRKNLLDLAELLANADSAADISRYLVGAGVTPAIKYGVNDLAGCNDFEEAFERITGSEIFDFNEKIIILYKWLKAIGHKKGWFDPPHEEDLARVTKQIESYARELNDKKAGADDAAVEPEPDVPDNGDIQDESSERDRLK